jgi:hypothetical protein
VPRLLIVRFDFAARSGRLLLVLEEKEIRMRDPLLSGRILTIHGSFSCASKFFEIESLHI